MYELAALISDPGAPQQPFHPDTRCDTFDGVAVLTAFVALQPIDELMGPTRFLPGTHTDPMPAATVAAGDATHLTAGEEGRLDGGGEAAGGAPPPSCVALLDTGDGALYDGRTLHCGGPNRSDRRRLLLYVTFRCSADAGGEGRGGGRTLGTLMDELWPR